MVVDATFWTFLYKYDLIVIAVALTVWLVLLITRGRAA